MLGFGPIGWIAGSVLMTIGIGTTAFGVNEVVSGIVGENLIRDWMGDGLYDGLYLGFNIGSAIGSFAGNIYMNYADIKIFDKSLPAKGKPFSRTSLLDRKGIKQYRFYDGKGAALYDKDFIHGGNMKFPHYHGWRNGIRTKGHWRFWKLFLWLLDK